MLEFNLLSIEPEFDFHGIVVLMNVKLAESLARDAADYYGLPITNNPDEITTLTEFMGISVKPMNVEPEDSVFIHYEGALVYILNTSTGILKRIPQIVIPSNWGRNYVAH